jgi:predicted peroxiredoxin
MISREPDRSLRKESPVERATNGRAVVNLATGHEDADRVTVAFLVGTSGLAAGKDVVMFLTKEAVRLAVPGFADAIESAGAPPVAKLFEQFADDGGELYACPICFDARRLDPENLVPNARIAGATPLWEFVGDGATVFSY